MSILQWNCNGYYPKYEELRQLLSRDNVSVACLQECRFGAQAQKPPRGFSLYSTAGPNAAHGGVAVLVHNSGPHSSLTLRTNLQTRAVQVQLKKKFTICSIYLPPDDHISEQDLGNLLDQLPAPFLLLGDFNAHHPIWGDVRTDNRGNIIERLLIGRNINILNENKPTHYHVQTDVFTAIDLSVCSSDVFNDFKWTVDDCLHSSEHFPIIVKVNEYTPYTHIPKFNYDKADWSSFKALIGINRDILNFNDIDAIIECFNKEILSVAEVCIPIKGGEFHLRPVPWWGPDIKSILSQKKQAYRRYCRTKLVVDKIEFNRLRALSRYKIKQARKNSWRKYVNSLNKDTPMKSVWKKFRKIDGKYTNAQQPILEENNTIITDPKIVADKIAQSIASISQANKYSPEFLRYKNNIENINISFYEENISEYNYDFTFKEFQIALEKSKNTAEGPDNIHYLLIRNLPEDIQLLLLQIYNKIWTENTFPKKWRESIVIPFLKPGKNPKVVTNYRPIALTSYVCKLMERMVNNRLMWIFETNGIISPMQ